MLYTYGERHVSCRTHLATSHTFPVSSLTFLAVPLVAAVLRRRLQVFFRARERPLQLRLDLVRVFLRGADPLVFLVGTCRCRYPLLRQIHGRRIRFRVGVPTCKTIISKVYGQFSRTNLKPIIRLRSYILLIKNNKFDDVTT